MTYERLKKMPIEDIALFLQAQFDKGYKLNQICEAMKVNKGTLRSYLNDRGYNFKAGIVFKIQSDTEQIELVEVSKDYKVLVDGHLENKYIPKDAKPKTLRICTELYEDLKELQYKKAYREDLQTLVNNALKEFIEKYK